MGKRRSRQQMTIDELAHETGVSSRNIRYYQTRGLLPPPTVEGRTGHYGKAHVERLQLIADMQGEGLNLQAIGWLLGGASSVESDEVRRLKRAVLDGWVTEKPIEADVSQIIGDVAPDQADAVVAQRAIDLGMIAPTDDPNRWTVLMPSVMAAGRELQAMGVPAERSIDALAVMKEHLAPIASEFVKLFDEAMLAPWDARGRPADEWPDIRAAVDRIRPLAGEAVLSVFSAAMAQVVAEMLEQAVVAELDV